MRLSEAILIGAAKRPMATGEYFGFGRGNACIASCALGAAFEAVTGKVPAGPLYSAGWVEDSLEENFPELFETFEMNGILTDIITRKNDSGKFTREDIAAWLAELGL